MNSKNSKPKTFSDMFTGTLAIIGGIVGTIVFVVNAFGELYADFDIEPTGLITGILTIAAFLLPLAISILVGGGIGLLAGGFLGLAIEFIVNSIVGFIKAKTELRCKRKKQKKATLEIKRANKSIDADIEKLNRLRKQITVDDRAVIADYNLCMLFGRLIENENSFMKCSSYCTEKYQTLLVIREIEMKIKLLAKEYETIGDTKNAELYFSKIRK